VSNGTEETTWPSAVVAIALVLLVTAVSVTAIVRYNVDEALKIWTRGTSPGDYARDGDGTTAVTIGWAEVRIQLGVVTHDSAVVCLTHCRSSLAFAVQLRECCYPGRVQIGFAPYLVAILSRLRSGTMS
jgi:hypothetical protein